jgi:hypothetical protein
VKKALETARARVGSVKLTAEKRNTPPQEMYTSAARRLRDQEPIMAPIAATIAALSTMLVNPGNLAASVVYPKSRKLAAVIHMWSGGFAQ